MEIDMGALDWMGPDWLASYYPPDLPEDWRLAYYANEYRCAGTAQTPASVLAQWAAGLPADFALWQRDKTPGEGVCLRRLRLPPPADAAGEDDAWLWRGRAVHPWAPGRETPAQVAVMRPEIAQDLVAARRWLTRFAAAAGPERRCLLVDAGPAQIERLRELQWLLGL